MGGIVGGLVQGGLGLLGSNRASRAQESAAQQAAAATGIRPLDVQNLAAINTGGGRFGGGLTGTTASLGAQLGQLTQDSLAQLTRGGPNFQLDIGALENERLGLLRQQAAPLEAARRAQLQSQLFSRGRLGVAGGGGLTGAQFNPETAALEEGLARADLQRQLSAADFARSDQDRLLRNAFNAINAEIGVRSLPLDVAAASAGFRNPSAGLGFLQAGQSRADFSNSLFAGLGSTLGPAIGSAIGGIFSGGGGSNAFNRNIANVEAGGGPRFIF